MSSKTPGVMSDSPEVIELFEIIAGLSDSADRFDGVIVRSVATKYATENDFFSGDGAAKSGGRWNPVGLPAIYASLDVITATHEAYQNFVKFCFPMSAIRPRVTAAAKARLAAVLDITRSEVLSHIGFSVADLIDEDWRAVQASGEQSWTQAIGSGCHAAGFEGMIVPSAQYADGRNIVIFPDKLRKNSQIDIISADHLPDYSG